MISIGRELLLIHAAATLAMVGLIWFVQIVHYPLMAEVGREGFRKYERDHQRLTTRVVAPWMLCEMVTALLLLWYQPPGIQMELFRAAFFILLGIWLMTYLVQMPQHESLALAFDSALHRRLVRGNWFRTAAWTIRGLLVLWMLRGIMNGGEEPSIESVQAGTLLRCMI